MTKEAFGDTGLNYILFMKADDENSYALNPSDNACFKGKGEDATKFSTAGNGVILLFMLAVFIILLDVAATYAPRDHMIWQLNEKYKDVFLHASITLALLMVKWGNYKRKRKTKMNHGIGYLEVDEEKGEYLVYESKILEGTTDDIVAKPEYSDLVLVDDIVWPIPLPEEDDKAISLELAIHTGDRDMHLAGSETKRPLDLQVIVALQRAEFVHNMKEDNKIWGMDILKYMFTIMTFNFLVGVYTRVGESFILNYDLEGKGPGLWKASSPVIQYMPVVVPIFWAVFLVSMIAWPIVKKLKCTKKYFKHPDEFFIILFLVCLGGLLFMGLHSTINKGCTPVEGEDEDAEDASRSSSTNSNSGSKTSSRTNHCLEHEQLIKKNRIK